jgi:hypothetical protein
MVKDMFPDIFMPSGPVENDAPLIVVAAALEVDSVVEVDTAVVFTPTTLDVELVIVEGVAVMITVLCVGVTALLWPAQTEYTDVPFDLEV